MRWLLDIARALAAIHATGLVHCDIKPHNILIDGDERARLIDLGLAAHRGMAGRVGAGTPGYSAPEQLAGHVDARSDQYAWGITAYELLVGTRPLGDVQPLIDLAPRPLADAIARAFARDAERRHPSMAALAALLEPYAERPTIDRHASTASPPVDPPPRRVRPSYALDAAVIALAFAVWLVASGARPQATASPSRVELTGTDALDDRELRAAIEACLDAHPTAPTLLTLDLPRRTLGWSDPDISRDFVACAQAVLDAAGARPRAAPKLHYELRAR